MARSDDGKFKSGASSSSKNLFFVSGKRPSGPEIYEHEAKQHRVSKKNWFLEYFILTLILTSPLKIVHDMRC